MDTTTAKAVGQMAEQINALGAGVVAIAIIFVLFLGLTMFVFTSFKKMIEHNQEKYDEMFDTIVRPHPSSAHGAEDDIFTSSIEIEKAIDEQLKYTCGITKCDRSAVYVFHNGTKTLSGSHLLKFSCLTEYANIYQHCANGKHQNIAIGQIKDVCNCFLNNKPFSSWNVSEMRDSSYTKEWLLAQKVKSTVASPIYGRTGSVIGFVVCDYMLDTAPLDAHEKILAGTKDLASKMSLLVDLDLIHERISGNHED